MIHRCRTSSCVVLLVSILTLVLPLAAQTEPRVVPRTSEELAEKIVKWQEPQYPAIARAARAGGLVTVELLIDEQGNVLTAKVISGHPLLHAVTLMAAKAWKFKPTIIDGVPVRVSGRLTHEFPKVEVTFGGRTIMQLERDVRRQSRSPRAHFALGSAYYESSRYQDAVSQLSAAVRLNPRYSDAFLKLGFSYSRLFQTQKALEAFSAAAKLDQKSSEAFQAMGMAHMRLGSYEEAVKAFESSLKGDEPPVSSYFMIGKCYLLLNRPASAIPIVQEGLTKDGESEVGYYVLGEAYLSTAQFDKAIEAFKQVTTLAAGPGSLYANYQLGIAYVRAGNLAAAMKQYEILKRMNNETFSEQLLEEIRLRAKQDGKTIG